MVELALGLYHPNPQTEKDQRKIFLINFFFSEAKKGLDIKIIPTYKLCVDGTVEKLTACSKSIENNDTIFQELEKEKERMRNESKEEKKPVKNNNSGQVVTNDPPQGGKEQGSTNAKESGNNKPNQAPKGNNTNSAQNSSKGKDEKVVEKKDSAEKTKAEDVHDERNKSTGKPNEEKIQSEQASSKEENVPLAVKVKNIWEKICFLETAYEFYTEANSIPENERMESFAFLHCIEGLYSIINHHSGIYGNILQDNNKIVI